MPKFLNEGDDAVLEAILNGPGAPDFLYLGLYTNVNEPGKADTLATAGITELPIANGYNRLPLQKGHWAVAGGVGLFDTQQDFGCSGVNWGYVTGYFITDNGSPTGNSISKTWCVEHFPDGGATGYNVVVGGHIKITPRILAD